MTCGESFGIIWWSSLRRHKPKKTTKTFGPERQYPRRDYVLGSCVGLVL
jgi:hypothetical protein